MGARRQYTDCRVVTKLNDVNAAAANNGTANSQAFDTAQGSGPSFIVDVVGLNQNKKLTMKMQHSDASAPRWTDVTMGKATTNVDPAQEITTNGLVKYNNADPCYTDIKRYIRMVVTSVGATPGASIRILTVLDGIETKPSLTGIN